LEFATDRKCDILPSAVWTNKEMIFSFTKPYLNIPFVLLTKSDTSFINNISSLKNKKISVVESYSIINTLRNKYKDIEFIEVEGIKKILNGEVFGHIDSISTSWYKFKEIFNKISFHRSLMKILIFL
jgi:ABC-type amino acid transport substrate-binding protein